MERTETKGINSILSGNQIAQYDTFGGDDRPTHGGAVTFNTNSIMSLNDEGMKELQVAHVWGSYYDPNWGQTVGGECAIALTRNGNDLIIAYKENQTCPNESYYNGKEQLPGIAGHTFNIGIRPNYDSGQRTFTSVYYWVFDLTTNETCWDITLDVPNIETFDATDYALESRDDMQLNNDSKIVYNFISLDQNKNPMQLFDNFRYIGGGSTVYTELHSESWDDTTALLDLRFYERIEVLPYYLVEFHDIPGSTDGALTDYQVRFVLHKGYGIDTNQDIYLDGFAQWGPRCWPHDFRFTNANNQKLSYWIESNDDNSAIVWVKVDYRAANPAMTQIKVYYSKDDDSGESDGDNTFLVFDHFNGTSLNSSKWVQWGTGTNTVSNSNLRLSTTGQNSVMAHYTNSIPLSNYVIETQGKVISPYYYQYNKYRPGILFRQGSAQNSGAVGFDTYAFDRDGWTVFDWSSWSWYDLSSPAGISPTDAYHGTFRLQVTVSGSSYTCREALRNKVISDSRGPTGSYFSLLVEKCTDDYDWVFVRKYTPHEPIQSMGMQGAAVSDNAQVNVAIDQSHNRTQSGNKTIISPNNNVVINDSGT